MLCPCKTVSYRPAGMGKLKKVLLVPPKPEIVENGKEQIQLSEFSLIMVQYSLVTAREQEDFFRPGPVRFTAS